MDDLRAALRGRLLADGGMGTELFARGLAGDCPERWNAEKPDVVRAIQRAYVDAGAQLLLTNTFGATAWKLEKSGHVADQERFCRAAAEVALAAAAGRAWVLADVGPTGELPAPYGTHAVEEFEAVFEQQIAILAAAGAHGVAVESMMSAVEAAAAVRAAKRACGLPVVASMTYNAGAQGYRTMMGETVAGATEALLDAGADVVGANCGLGAAQMAEVVAEVRAATDRPVWAKPNAGQPRLDGDRTVFDEPPDAWAAQVPAILDAGATVVGGCCGTTPEHIARARAAVLGSE
jgi:5-methyltetrahydrofolate--homocysteine methyltransferase